MGKMNTSCPALGSTQPPPAYAGRPTVLSAAPAASDSSRTRRLVWLLVAAWMINLFDLVFTLMAHQQGLLTELNPLAAWVIPYGPAALAAYKITLLGLGTALLWSGRRLPMAEQGTWLYVLVCVVLSLHWYQLYREVDVPRLVSRPGTSITSAQVPEPVAMALPGPPDSSGRPG